jgi:pimeloyl-ACP methyl ester carboxylesterase
LRTPPTTIVLIHGLWMTPRSWDPFKTLYEQRGYRVLAPAWPRLVGDVEQIRRDPSALAGLGILEIVDHYAHIVRRLDAPPILIGHSFGGLVVQMLLDRGLGVAGVGIDAAAPKGVWRLPASQIRANLPVLANPANRRRTVGFTFEQFRYAFANTMSEPDARSAYERNAIPGPGRLVFQAAFANFTPRPATRVDYRNDDRAPLLLIAGGEDHVVPASVNRANHRKYRHAKPHTDFMEFSGRSHLIVAQTGWREVAECALAWAEAHTTVDAGLLAVPQQAAAR